MYDAPRTDNRGGRDVYARLSAAVLVLLPAMAVAAYSGEAEAEVLMLELLNAARIEEGLSPLVMDPAFTQVARQHSWEMKNLDYFSHESPVPGNDTVPRRVANAGLTEVWVGENIGADYRSGPYDREKLTRLAFEGLMDSPSHRANILDPDFNRVGIGIVRATRGSLEGILVTQVFTAKRIELNPVSIVSDGAFYNVKLSGWLPAGSWAGCFVSGATADFVPIKPEPDGFFATIIKLRRGTGTYTLKLGLGPDEYGSKDIFNRFNVDTDRSVKEAFYIDGSS
ncbi:MAG TPA: CAP domain-containing protein [Candidatus Coatesbacteria bacterium]|nr:CAP domain-containing protein [Candidatus Coatesbacteria bacterium]